VSSGSFFLLNFKSRYISNADLLHIFLLFWKKAEVSIGPSDDLSASQSAVKLTMPQSTAKLVMPSSPPLDESPDSPITPCTNLSSDIMSVNVGYYQSWAIWRQPPCQPFYASDIDVSGMGYTHLVYSFASISASMLIEPWMGNLVDEALNYAAFNALKKKHLNLKTLIAVGGLVHNVPGETCGRFHVVSSSAPNRIKFADSVVTFLRQVRG